MRNQIIESLKRTELLDVVLLNHRKKLFDSLSNSVNVNSIDCRLGKYLNEIEELKQCLLFKELSSKCRQAEQDVLRSSNCNLLCAQFSKVVCYLISEMEGDKYTEKYVAKRYYEDVSYPNVVNTIYIVNEKLFEELRNNEIRSQEENARQNPIDYVDDYCNVIKTVGLAIVFPDISRYEYVGRLINKFESGIIWNNKLYFEGCFDYLNDFFRYITFKQYQSKRIFNFDEIMDLADAFICDMKEKNDDVISKHHYQKTNEHK